jgi:hypothetical protein
MATRVSQFRAVTPALVEHRRAERFTVTVTRATVRKQHGAPAEATLHDLSIYGCRLETSAIYAPDERLWLQLNGSLPIAASVVWCKDGFIGCRFDEAIPRPLVRELTLTIR